MHEICSDHPAVNINDTHPLVALCLQQGYLFRLATFVP